MSRDLVKLALLAGAGWFVYTRMRELPAALANAASSAASSAGSAVAQAAWSIARDEREEDLAITSGGFLKAINGTAVSIDYLTGRGWVPRLYNWELGRYQDVPGLGLPDNWRNAPDVVRGQGKVKDLKAAGRPWYQPWDGTHLGLRSNWETS